jgi:hypothetical protein
MGFYHCQCRRRWIRCHCNQSVYGCKITYLLQVLGNGGRGDSVAVEELLQRIPQTGVCAQIAVPAAVCALKNRFVLFIFLYISPYRLGVGIMI